MDARFINVSGETEPVQTASYLKSTIATGTAPVQVNSTTLCENLNADLLDGKHANELGGALTVQHLRALPLSLYDVEPEKFEWTYDGEYLKLDCKVTGHYPSCRSGYALERGLALKASATVRGDPTPTSIYYFFFETMYVGNYNDFQGFRHDGVNYCVESRRNGVETQTNLSGQDWSVDTEFHISCRANQTLISFYINGSLVAQHTTNISPQPYEIGCMEPNAVIRTVYLKHPPGIKIRQDGAE